MRVAALSILSRDQLRAGALLPMRFAVRAIHPNFQKPHVVMGGIMAVGCWNERESRSTGGVSASLLRFPGVDNTQQGRKNACRLRATTNLLEPNAGLGQASDVPPAHPKARVRDDPFQGRVNSLITPSEQ
jgi:hypothetical protein